MTQEGFYLTKVKSDIVLLSKNKEKLLSVFNVEKKIIFRIAMTSLFNGEKQKRI